MTLIMVFLVARNREKIDMEDVGVVLFCTLSLFCAMLLDFITTAYFITR